MKAPLVLFLGLIFFQASIQEPSSSCAPSSSMLKHKDDTSDEYITEDVDNCLFRVLEDGDLICCLFEVDDVEFCRGLTPLQYADITHYVEVLEDRYDADVDIDCNAKYLTLGFLAIIIMIF